MKLPELVMLLRAPEEDGDEEEEGTDGEKCLEEGNAVLRVLGEWGTKWEGFEREEGSGLKAN